MWIADAFAHMFKATIFRRALADPHFFFERTSSVFAHPHSLVKCSLRITHLNARPTAELKIALADKLNTVGSVFVLILIPSRGRKETVPGC